MKTLLKDLYDCFYTPPEFSEQKREVEECHQALIKVLEKPERRLVLRIMDTQSLMAEERSIDSFISGFELAWQLSMELNQFEKERSVSRLHMPPQKCSLTADDGASPPPEWCTASAEMVHGGRERGAPDRHAGNYSGMPLRFRMDSPSIWMV